MDSVLSYLSARPSASKRLALVYALLAAPLVYVGGVLLLLPVQESRLLGEPLFSTMDAPLWALGAVLLLAAFQWARQLLA